MEASAATGLALARARPRVPARVLAIASDERLVATVRAGSEQAFEAIVNRYQRGLLGFCRHMLGSIDEAEDAVQHVFLAAYRDLVDGDRAIELRPWLYTIARNRCLSVVRARRGQRAELPSDAATEHLSAEVQRRQDVRDLLADVAKLPDDQRAALVLTELATMPHAEIAHVLGCRTEKVKSLVFQARSSLLASRAGREAACDDIRRQLATERAGALRRTVIRRHLRECAGCREFRSQLRRQRRLLGLALPLAPSALKTGALAGEALGGGAGSGLVVKALTVVAIAGGGTVAVHDARPPGPATVTKQTAPQVASGPRRTPAPAVVTVNPSTAPRRGLPAGTIRQGRPAGSRARGNAPPRVAGTRPAPAPVDSAAHDAATHADRTGAERAMPAHKGREASPAGRSAGKLRTSTAKQAGRKSPARPAGHVLRKSAPSGGHAGEKPPAPPAGHTAAKPSAPPGGHAGDKSPASPVGPAAESRPATARSETAAPGGQESARGESGR